MSNFALRIPESLLASAKELAGMEKTSLNQFFAIAIAEKVSSMKTARFFAERGAQGDPQAALAILAKSPRTAPPLEDRIAPAERKQLRARIRKAAANVSAASSARGAK